MSEPISSVPVAKPVLDVDSLRLQRSEEAQAVEIGRHFEAMLIQELIKASRGASGGGWLGENADQSSEATAQMGEEFLARALASKGGLGLASALSASIQKSLVR